MPEEELRTERERAREATQRLHRVVNSEAMAVSLAVAGTGAVTVDAIVSVAMAVIVPVRGRGRVRYCVLGRGLPRL